MQLFQQMLQIRSCNSSRKDCAEPIVMQRFHKQALYGDSYALIVSAGIGPSLGLHLGTSETSSKAETCWITLSCIKWGKNKYCSLD